MLHTIVLDFDGVLVRSRYPDGRYLWNDRVEQELQISEAVLHELFSFPEWDAALRGKLDVPQKFQDVLSRYAPHLTLERFQSFWLQSDLNWYPETLKIAEALKLAGHRLVIGTNQEPVRREFLKSRPEIQKLFVSFIASSDLGFAKPDAEWFRLAQGQIPQDRPFLFIDDRIENIKVAETFGWKGIHFDPDLLGTSFEFLKKELAQTLQDKH